MRGTVSSLSTMSLYFYPSVGSLGGIVGYLPTDPSRVMKRSYSQAWASDGLGEGVRVKSVD